MLNPRPARVPETLLNTPGSFCTKQFKTCCFRGALEGKGVSYKMDRTAESADQFGVSKVGSGGLFWLRWSCLYARADVRLDDLHRTVLKKGDDLRNMVTSRGSPAFIFHRCSGQRGGGLYAVPGQSCAMTLQDLFANWMYCSIIFGY